MRSPECSHDSKALCYNLLSKDGHACLLSSRKQVYAQRLQRMKLRPPCSRQRQRAYLDLDTHDWSVYTAPSRLQDPNA